MTGYGCSSRTRSVSGRYVVVALLLGACTVAGPAPSVPPPDLGPPDPILELRPISAGAEAQAAQLFARAEEAFRAGRLVEARRLTAEIVGDPDDVYNGDAMPTAESGWQIEDRIETDSEGKKELTRTASREIAAGAAIPDSYATPNSRLDLTALQFPTTVTIEHRDDGERADRELDEQDQHGIGQ